VPFLVLGFADYLVNSVLAAAKWRESREVAADRQFVSVFDLLKLQVGNSASFLITLHYLDSHVLIAADYRNLCLGIEESFVSVERNDGGDSNCSVAAPF
jgi:hypothetical protein